MVKLLSNKHVMAASVILYLCACLYAGLNDEAVEGAVGFLIGYLVSKLEQL